MVGEAEVGRQGRRLEEQGDDGEGRVVGAAPGEDAQQRVHRRIGQATVGGRVEQRHHEVGGGEEVSRRAPRRRCPLAGRVVYPAGRRGPGRADPSSVEAAEVVEAVEVGRNGRGRGRRAAIGR